MNLAQSPDRKSHAHRLGWLLLAVALVLTTAVYSPGLSGGFQFDDYPNIVDNRGVQPEDASVSSLVRAALSSPSSRFKRPLASLSFAANYLIGGLDPFGWKLFNLAVHLLNGVLVFLLARGLLLATGRRAAGGALAIASRDPPARIDARRAGMVAALIAAGWMLLPINLTAVLYVVQRMESMANLFVLLGLAGYVVGRRRMLAAPDGDPAAGRQRATTRIRRLARQHRNLLLCAFSVTVFTALGLLAKETAVMLPLYAALIEWAVFRLRKPGDAAGNDWRIATLFLLVLVLPMVIGLAWLLPGLFAPETWAIRDFTMATRLLSEARIVVDYIVWTLLPTPEALSFYHDDFVISTGLLAPWSTLASLAVLAGLLGLALWARARRPLFALGLALFLGCHLLTGTIIPLELIYEHRNYFASFGLLLAIVPLLAAPRARPLALPRQVLLGGLLLSWTALTALTAHAWGHPLRLAEELAARAPQSPRALYQLGRTYIIYSDYDPSSPFTALAYPPLEKAAALPDASILPEQALIMMNQRMHRPVKTAWWRSLIAKLRAHELSNEDEAALGSLSKCTIKQRCDLPPTRMMAAFMAALSHPDPSAHVLASYGDYAWNVLGDRALAERMIEAAVEAKPGEPTYRITLIRMLAVQGRKADACAAIKELEALNVGGRLDRRLRELRAL